MNGFNGEFLRGALDVAPDGVVICEAGGDRLVVYANPAFCRLTGYDVGELVGKNLRLLQGDDRDQPELETLRDALRHSEGARALQLHRQKRDLVAHLVEDGDAALLERLEVAVEAPPAFREQDDGHAPLHEQAVEIGQELAVVACLA